MSSHREQQSGVEGDKYRELRLLSEVQRTPETSQRSLSRRAGMALGMTNLLLRNLARKGYVRITRAGWRSWMYTLTPAGFSRKIQLTTAYVHRVLDQYRWVRQTLRGELEPLGLNAESRVALYGRDEFAEMVYLGLKEMGIEEVDVFAPVTSPGGKFLGLSVRDVAALRSEQYDRVIVASLGNAATRCAELRAAGVAAGKLFNPFSDSHGGVEMTGEGV